MFLGSVDVGNESCPQSLLRDRQFTSSLVVGTQFGRFMRWLFVLKLEAATVFAAAAVYSYLPSRDANSSMA